MSFWSKIFRRRNRIQQADSEDVWDELVYDRAGVDFQVEEQRSRYVTGCLEQMAEATKEIHLLNGEYGLVTSYLTDMEEIEALPEIPRSELNRIATHLVTLEHERERYRAKKNRMKDSEFYQMRRQEEEVAEGIAKIKEAEDYGKRVKHDLQRLDAERHAYEYRQKELLAFQNNLRGMAIIFVTALAACLVMLAILQFGFEMNTSIGYFLSILAGAIALTVVCIKYIDSDREIQTVENGIGRLIQLQNKVKIRYVNNTNLLEYLYIKYETDSAAVLEKRWESYQEEKEERKQYAEAEAKIEYYQNALVNKLSGYRVRDPHRWVNQPGAILDSREMVELRHGLILRRQALRKQLNYNNSVAESARAELDDIISMYPAYEQEIRDMMAKYQVQS